MKQIPLLLVLAFGASVLAGCSKTDENAPYTSTTTTAPAKSSKLPAGWKTVKTKEDNISISIPPTWTAVDLTMGQMTKAMDEASKADPKIAKVRHLVESAATNKSSKLTVVCTEPEPNFSSSLNIVKLPTQGASTDEILRLNKEFLEKSLGVRSVSEKIKLPAGDAFLSKTELTMVNQKISMRSYLIVKGDSYFVITVGLAADAPKKRIDEAEQMVQTVNLGS